MNNDTHTQKRDIVTSVRMPLTLRGQLDDLRVARAQRGMKLPRLRDLVLEALRSLVAQEADKSLATEVVR